MLRAIHVQEDLKMADKKAYIILYGAVDLETKPLHEVFLNRDDALTYAREGAEEQLDDAVSIKEYTPDESREKYHAIVLESKPHRWTDWWYIVECNLNE